MIEIGNIENKLSERVDLSDYFGDDSFCIIKYIPRDKWRYINKLTIKTDAMAIYNEMVKNKEKNIDGLDIQGVYSKISENDLLKYSENLSRVEYELFEAGLDKKDHCFVRNGKAVELTKDLIEGLSNKKVNDLNFYDFLLKMIRDFNGKFDLGEPR